MDENHGRKPDLHNQWFGDEGGIIVKLCDDNYYYVFPTYGIEFRNMMPWLADWQRNFRGEHHFWHGFAGGGILSVSALIPAQKRHGLVLNTMACHQKGIYGMVLGNAGGQRLAKCLSCALGERPPEFVVKAGLAERVPDPTVKTTAEHVDCLGDDRILLVVPKAKAGNLKLLDRLPEWFAAFGVQVEAATCKIRDDLRSEMADWFGDPSRTMFAFRMSGGEDNAAWQTAVIYHIAEYWDTTVRGLDSLHLVATIDEAPNFRRNWTSNK